jgi:hypothetical protein
VNIRIQNPEFRIQNEACRCGAPGIILASGFWLLASGSQEEVGTRKTDGVE